MSTTSRTMQQAHEAAIADVNLALDDLLAAYRSDPVRPTEVVRARRAVEIAQRSAAAIAEQFEDALPNKIEEN